MKRFARNITRTMPRSAFLKRQPMVTMSMRSYVTRGNNQAWKAFETYQSRQHYKHNEGNNQNSWNHRNYSKNNSTIVTPGMHWAKPIMGVGAAVLGYIILDQIFNKTKTGTSVESSSLMNASITRFQRDFLSGTYGYMCLGLGLTGLSAFGAVRTGLAAKFFSLSPFMQIGLSLGGVMGLGMLTRSINPENLPMKAVSWAAFNGFIGLLMAPYIFMNPTILLRAAMYTAAVFFGMTAIALNAEQERFLFMGGALYAGLLVLILASVGTAFMPARFVRAQSTMANLLTYGGLGIFTLFLLYDTQKILHVAKVTEQRMQYSIKKPSPMALSGLKMDASMKLYMDVINLFTHFVAMQRRR